MKEKSIWFYIEATGALITAIWLRVPLAGQFYIVAMCFDVLTGVMLAAKRGVWTSRTMRDRLWTKAGECLIIAGLFALERYTGVPFGAAVAGWFAFREIGSSLENAEGLGVKLPPFLRRALHNAQTGYVESRTNEVSNEDDV